MLSSFAAIAQSLKAPQKTEKRIKYFVLPLAFYTPETRFGAGASGIVTFHFKNDSIYGRPSNIQFGVAYTSLKQVLFYLPFQIFLKNEEFLIYGEGGYYIYNYLFYGIGNQQPHNAHETYGVNYPRLRFNALTRVYKQLYAGMRYSLDNFYITSTDPAGKLQTDNITGSNGGITSGIGGVLRYDNRDNIFSPSTGYYAEFFLQVDDKWTGSNFKFIKYSLDVSTYLTNRFYHTFAVNFYSVINTGNPPFNQMALMGGTKKMRGYYEGRYRDKSMTLLQAEYRMPLFWRLGAVAFAGCGVVADKLPNYNVANLKYTYGAGMRIMIDQKQKINIRLDYGIGEREGNFYLTITEAF